MIDFTEVLFLKINKCTGDIENSSWAVPLLISILVPIKLIGIYLLAVYNDHVTPIYPYISDSGALHPEAGLFSMLLLLESYLVVTMGFIRYKQIKYVCDHNTDSKDKDKSIVVTNFESVKRLNRFGLCVSICLSLSMSITAAFRSTEHFELHFLLGAIPALVCFGLHVSIQTSLSFKLIPRVNSLFVARLRLFITLLSLILGVIMVISTAMAVLVLQSNDIPYSDLRGELRLRWPDSWGGLEEHIISTVSENLLILMLSPFCATFVSEFKKINIKNNEFVYEILK